MRPPLHQGDYVGDMRIDEATTRRGGTETTFGLRARIYLTAGSVLLTILGWVILAPTVIAVPTILIPGFFVLVKVLREPWRPVPLEDVHPDPSPQPSLADLREARDRGWATPARLWLMALAALTYAAVVLAYVTGGEERRFIILGSVVIASGVLAMRWALRRHD